MGKTKELLIQQREWEMHCWDAFDADYFYNKYKESSNNLNVCE